MRGRSLLLVFAAGALAGALVLLAMLLRAPGPAPEAAADEPAERSSEPSPRRAPPPRESSTRTAAPPALPDRPHEQVAGTGAEPAGARGGAPRDGGGRPIIPPPRVYEPSSPLDARRHEVIRIYNRKRFEEAAAAARAVLEDRPDDRGMLRIAATSACILGERQRAAELVARMVRRDQRRIRERCDRHGVSLDR